MEQRLRRQQQQLAPAAAAVAAADSVRVRKQAVMQAGGQAGTRSLAAPSPADFADLAALGAAGPKVLGA